jgi:peptide/nickel transport system substrate-binding protein
MKRFLFIAGFTLAGLLSWRHFDRQETLRPAGFLVVGIAEDKESLDPVHVIDMDWTPVAQICETLVVRHPGGDLEPGLALSWERVSERTWRFKLREGIRFQDGNRFDAMAAKLSLNRAGQVQSNWLSFRFQSIDVPDERTLLVMTDRPFAPLPEYLSYVNFAIVSPATLAKGNDEVARRPIGTGPFRLEQYTPGQTAVLTRNEAYWAGLPRLPGLVYRVIPDPLTRLLALEAGEIDLMRFVPLPELPRLRTSSQLRVVTGPGRHVHHLTFNRATSPLRRYFDDIRVRRAFNYAVDRQALVDVILNDAGEPATGAVPSWMEAAAAVPGYPHDITRAKRLLAEAGWPGEARIHYVFSPGWLPQNGALAELLEAQFRAAGIDLILEPMEFGGAMAAEKTGEADVRHRGIPLTTGGTYYALWTRYASANSALTSVYYRNAAVDRLFTAAEIAPTRADEKDLLSRIQQAVSDDAADIPLFYEYDVVALSRSVRTAFGEDQGLLSKPELKDAWIEQSP